TRIPENTRDDLPDRPAPWTAGLGAPLGGLPAGQLDGVGPSSDPVPRFKNDERPPGFPDRRRRREPGRAGPENNAVQETFSRFPAHPLCSWGDRAGPRHPRSSARKTKRRETFRRASAQRNSRNARAVGEALQSQPIRQTFATGWALASGAASRA